MSGESELISPALVPELLVTDLAGSLDFWVGLCGFEVLYERPDEGFASIRLGAAHVMLDQIGRGRDWETGSLERPLGRGINFEVSVPSAEAMAKHLLDAHWPLFLEPETKWYRTSEGIIGVRQFLVQDPDGYLLRFTSRLVDGQASRE